MGVHACTVARLKLGALQSGVPSYARIERTRASLSLCLFRCIRGQALHHMTAGPAVWPALARCTALADLCVVLPDAALAERFATLPPSLTRLKASGINALEVCSAHMSPGLTQITLPEVSRTMHKSAYVMGLLPSWVPRPFASCHVTRFVPLPFCCLLLHLLSQCREAFWRGRPS